MACFCDECEVSKNTMSDAARFRNEHVTQSLCDCKPSNKMSSRPLYTWSLLPPLPANRGDAEVEPFWVIPRDPPSPCALRSNEGGDGLGHTVSGPHGVWKAPARLPAMAQRQRPGGQPTHHPPSPRETPRHFPSLLRWPWDVTPLVPRGSSPLDLVPVNNELEFSSTEAHPPCPPSARGTAGLGVFMRRLGTGAVSSTAAEIPSSKLTRAMVPTAHLSPPPREKGVQGFVSSGTAEGAAGPALAPSPDSTPVCPHTRLCSVPTLLCAKKAFLSVLFVGHVVELGVGGWQRLRLEGEGTQVLRGRPGPGPSSHARGSRRLAGRRRTSPASG